jgi:hypothetical protein
LRKIHEDEEEKMRDDDFEKDNPIEMAKAAEASELCAVFQANKLTVEEKKIIIKMMVTDHK